MRLQPQDLFFPRAIVGEKHFSHSDLAAK